MCETRDLGIKWPQWHTLTSEGEARIDMRYVCPKDVKKMLVQQARSFYWTKWAAKHEYEELKEGIWLEPALALLSKKTKEDWTEKHRNVARKLFLEGGWVQQRLFDIGWSDESKCQACHKEKGTEKHRLYHCPKWFESGCGWSVVQLDCDEEMVPLHGMYGSMEAEFEVQRTVKRAELTAFLCLLKKVIYVDNKGISDGLWRGEKIH